MERQRKRLKELTIKDNFMFAAVMLDSENAKGLIELALGIQVERIEVSYEKSIVYNPEYKGVRLDVYLKDELGRHINVEMQTTSQQLHKRARYYHSQIDMDLLVSGEEYEHLPDSYVLFICDFDPIGLKKYKYTIKQSLEEDSGYEYEDGNHTVFLNTAGTNDNEVPEALVKLAAELLFTVFRLCALAASMLANRCAYRKSCKGCSKYMNRPQAASAASYAEGGMVYECM